MAFVALGVGTGNSSDLNQAAYSYGFFNDIVLVLDGSTNRYDILTYEGNDIVYNTRTTAKLNAFSFQQAFLGEGNDKYFGGGGEDATYDGSGNDYVSLGAGNDLAHACAGNDTLIGGAGIDVISFVEANYDGVGSLDFNFSGVIVDLLKTTAQNFGVFGLDTISGFENVTGGQGNDRIFGTDGANVFDGFGGNDFYDSRGGNDTVYARGGIETIIGGGGADTIYVGESTAFRDTLKYNAISDSGITATTWDTIYSFDLGGLATDDKIDLSAIDANLTLAGDQAFVFDGTGPFHLAGGEVRLVVSGTDTYVYVDNDADVAPEMIIRLGFLSGLTAKDFIL